MPQAQSLNCTNCPSGLWDQFNTELKYDQSQSLSRAYLQHHVLHHFRTGTPFISVICYCPNDPLSCQEPWILCYLKQNNCALFKTALSRVEENIKAGFKMINSQWKCLSSTFNYLDILNLYLQGDKTIVNTSRKQKNFQVCGVFSSPFSCQNIPVSQSWIGVSHCPPKFPMQCQFFWSSSRIVQLTHINTFTSFKPTVLLH